MNSLLLTSEGFFRTCSAISGCDSRKLSMLASSRCVVSESFCGGIALCVCAPAGATQIRVPSARVASQYRVVSPVRCIRIQPPEEKDSLYLRMDFVQKCTAETNTRRTEHPG